MRVLYCIWEMVVGGAERQLVQLTAALTRRDVDVHVVTAREGVLDGALRSAGATLHRVRPIGEYDPFLPVRLALLIDRLQPDVVHTWLTKMDVAGGAAAWLTGVPWVLAERSSRGAYFPSVLHGLRRRMGVHARLNVANSEGGRDYWRPFIGSDRIHVIPNIVPQSEIAAAIPEKNGVPAGTDVILFAGGFRPEKNVLRLIEALALTMQRSDAVAVFCGDGPLRGAVETRVRALGIERRIFFKGTVDNVWPWMKRASAVVSVSLYEGNPNSVLEAMACLAPLVVSDIEAHRALLDERSAAMVDPASPESIATGLLAVLAAPEEARARAARASASLEGHTPEQIAARYEQVYRGVVEEAEPAGDPAYVSSAE